MNTLHIKKDDIVVVLSGDSKGVRGKVIAVSPKEGKVIVEGANMVKKHNKARRQGDVSSIVETEGAIYASKVQLVCPACDRGVRAKARFDTDKDGNQVKVRVCPKCGKEI